jgi:hypothetical protein
MKESNLVRRALSGALIALVVVFGAELGLRVVERHFPEPMQWPSQEAASKVAQMEHLESETGIDVVLVGSSVVAEGIDPVAYSESAGEVAYNAALSAASMRSTELWMADVVVPLTHPTAVVIGVTGRDLNDNGISQTEFYERLTSSPGYLDMRSPRNPVEEVEEWLLEHSALIRLRPILRDPAAIAVELGFQNPDSDAESDVGPLGSDMSYEGASYPRISDWRSLFLSRHLNSYSVGDAEIDALTRMVSDLRRNGISVLLVNMPVTDDYVGTLPDGERDMAELDLILSDLASATGSGYVDVSEEFVRLDFRDPAHLTPRAASTLAIELAQWTTSTRKNAGDL